MKVVKKGLDRALVSCAPSPATTPQTRGGSQHRVHRQLGKRMSFFAEPTSCTMADHEGCLLSVAFLTASWTNAASESLIFRLCLFFFFSPGLIYCCSLLSAPMELRSCRTPLPQEGAIARAAAKLRRSRAGRRPPREPHGRHGCTVAPKLKHTLICWGRLRSSRS